MLDYYAPDNPAIEHQIESLLVLPAQFYPSPSHTHPALRLLDEMVREAVFTLRAAAFPPVSTRLQRLAYEDTQWFLDTRQDPGSFLWCAAHLGLDAEGVRATLQPLFIAVPPKPGARKPHQFKSYAGYRFFDNVTVTGRTRYYLMVRVAQVHTQVSFQSTHPQCTLSAPGDTGTLIITHQAARKAGLGRPRRNYPDRLKKLRIAH